MSREKLNAHKWEDIVREMHEKPTPPHASGAVVVSTPKQALMRSEMCPDCQHVPCLPSCWRTHAPPGVDTAIRSMPAQLSEKEEFARRPFGSVNGYIQRLEAENAALKRRVRVLEELVSKS